MAPLDQDGQAEGIGAEPHPRFDAMMAAARDALEGLAEGGWTLQRTVLVNASGAREIPTLSGGAPGLTLVPSVGDDGEVRWRIGMGQGAMPVNGNGASQFRDPQSAARAAVELGEQVGFDRSQEWSQSDRQRAQSAANTLLAPHLARDAAAYAERQRARAGEAIAEMAERGFDVSQPHWVAVTDGEKPALLYPVGLQGIVYAYANRDAAAQVADHNVAPAYVRRGMVADLTSINDGASEVSIERVLRDLWEQNSEGIKRTWFIHHLDREAVARRLGESAYAEEADAIEALDRQAEALTFDDYVAHIRRADWHPLAGAFEGDALAAIMAAAQDAGFTALLHREVPQAAPRLALFNSRDVELAWDKLDASIAAATRGREAARQATEAYKARFQAEQLAQRQAELEAMRASLDLAQLESDGFATGRADIGHYPVSSRDYADLDPVDHAGLRGHPVFRTRAEAEAVGSLLAGGPRQSVPVYVRTGRIADLSAQPWPDKVREAAGQLLTANRQVFSSFGINDGGQLEQVVARGDWSAFGQHGNELSSMLVQVMQRAGYDSVRLRSPSGEVVWVFSEADLHLAVDELYRDPMDGLARQSTTRDGTPAIGMGPRTAQLLGLKTRGERMALGVAGGSSGLLSGPAEQSPVREDLVSAADFAAEVRLTVSPEAIVFSVAGERLVAVDGDARR
ncbi:hypothetical protein, partial [Azospirillum sp. B4]|uniref:hypothetical protein n=1 Tax=Azospirillum sp. B4 TaxID=95605 RepID=UPI0005C933F8